MKQVIGWALLCAVVAACSGASGTETPAGGSTPNGAPAAHGNFTLKGKSFR